ncbi:hypothetical protein Tco_0842234 [Tanacetum coccineum]|uniref:Uncharacterized protein n=1 Tax=Tanacetum coccineum TaxID=301880 RepID=A0ABQ5B0V2_9ASTR
MGALLSDMVKNPKLNVKSTSLVLSASSYLMEDPQCSSRIHNSINAIMICPKQPNKSYDSKSEEEEEEKGKPENIDINPPSPLDPTILLITKKEDDGDIMFIEIIKKYEDSHEEELEEDENTMAGEMGVEYFDIFLTRSELAYHKLYFMRRSLEVLRKFPDDDSWRTI